jgi:hypothetical protein
MNHLGDTNKMVDTPRMKAAVMAAMEHGTGDVWRVGCDIERELNAACEMYRKLDIHTLNLVDRIRRLEAAGDELLRDNDDMANIRGWWRAKEANP